MFREDETIARLSFTEYTLQGFSQERPFNPQDYVGKWCSLSDYENDIGGITLNKVCAYDGRFIDTDQIPWDNAKPLTEDQLKAFNITND